MSQYNFSPIDPSTKSGTSLASDLDLKMAALDSCHKGPSRPSYVTDGMIWVNDSDPLSWKVNVANGANDVLIGTVDTANDTFSASGAPVTYMATGTTINNSITPVVAAGLESSLSGATNYAIEVHIELGQYASGANIRIGLYTGSGSKGSGTWSIVGDTTYQTVLQKSFTSSINYPTLITDVQDPLVIKGSFNILTGPTVTAGVYFRQDVAVVGDTSINAGSWMRVTKIS